MNKVLSHSPYGTWYSGTSIKRRAKRLGKFVRYSEHLDPTDCTTVNAVMLSVCVFVVVVVFFSCCKYAPFSMLGVFFFFFHSRCV